MSKSKPKLVGRIRYVEDYDGKGHEYYVFENKWTDEEHWGLECAFRLLDYDDGVRHEDAVLLSYQALTCIRNWLRLGMTFHFE